MTAESQPPSSPPGTGIKTAPDVWVDDRDRWRFKDEIIRNEEVLGYFKANLHRDDEGYFIENRWGERVENGYLRGVFGFPLRAIRLDFLDGLSVELLLDSGALTVASLTELFYLDEHTIGFLETNARLPIRLSAQAMVQMSERLVIDDEDRVWFQIPDSKKFTLPLSSREEIFPGTPPHYEPGAAAATEI